MHRFLKQPSEQYNIVIDFSDILSTGETISSIEVTAYDRSSDSTSSIIGDSSIDDDTVIVFVQNGLSDRVYKISVIITTSTSQVFEEDIWMSVYER